MPQETRLCCTARAMTSSSSTIIIRYMAVPLLSLAKRIFAIRFATLLDSVKNMDSRRVFSTHSRSRSRFSQMIILLQYNLLFFLLPPGIHSHDSRGCSGRCQHNFRKVPLFLKRAFPSGLANSSFARWIQQESTPTACAASIRFPMTRAVLHISSALRVSKHDQNGWSAVERIGCCTHNSRIHFRKLCNQLRFLYHNNHRRLFSHAGCRIRSGLQNCIELLIGNLLRFVFADASSCFDCILILRCSW